MRIFLGARKYFLTVFLLFSFSPAHATDGVESTTWKAAVGTTIMLIAATNPLNASSMSTGVGGGDHFSVARIGANWDWNDNLLHVFGWEVSSYWQLDFSRWQSTVDSSQAGANLTVGLTPMFRFNGKPGYVQQFLDVGVGASFFTDSQLKDHQFGSNFQFSDVISIGANVGKRNQWGYAYKFQHYSNGSVRVPNHGINFHFLTLTYKY